MSTSEDIKSAQVLWNNAKRGLRTLDADANDVLARPRTVAGDSSHEDGKGRRDGVDAMSRRRVRNDVRRALRQRARKRAKIKSCDPRRLWPLDSVQRQDFEVDYCGDFDRVMKWIWGGRDVFLGRPNPIERLIYSDQPLFGLIPRGD